MTKRDNMEIRRLQDKDLQNLIFAKGTRMASRDQPYKYGTPITQEVVEGEIPGWAQAVLDSNTKKPGEKVGQYGEINRRELTFRDMVR